MHINTIFTPAVALLSAAIAVPYAKAENAEATKIPGLMEACPHMGQYGTVIVDTTFTQDLSGWNKVLKMTGRIENPSAADLAISLTFSQLDEKTNGRTLLIVDSGGGNVRQGQSIINAMDLSVVPVDTICIGDASSMASAVLVSGEHAYGTRNCIMVTHEARMNSDGSTLFASDAATLATNLRGANDKIKNTYMLKGQFDNKCASFLVSPEDIILTARDALLLGLLDAIVLPGGRMEVRSDNKIPTKAEPSATSSTSANGGPDPSP